MKLEWIILAEGIGQDSRGAFTLIGINQNVLTIPRLPRATKRIVMPHLVVDEKEFKPGDSVAFKVSVISPSNEILSAHPGQIALGEVMWPDLPVALDLPVDVMLNCSEYGAYRVEVIAQLGGDSVKSDVIIYVRQPTPEDRGGPTGVAQPFQNSEDLAKS